MHEFDAQKVCMMCNEKILVRSADSLNKPWEEVTTLCIQCFKETPLRLIRSLHMTNCQMAYMRYELNGIRQYLHQQHHMQHSVEG